MFIKSHEEYKCEACIAKEYHIADLKEQINYLRGEVERLTEHIMTLEANNLGIVNHFTGINRARNGLNNQEQEFRSVPRKVGIQSRLRSMERQVNQESETAIAQRNREYHERIDKLMNPNEPGIREPEPEIEVIKNDAV